MERIGQMEPILAGYISQQFPDAEVDFLPNIDNVPQPQVMQHIKSCDVIAVQSIFDKEFDATFEKMIALFSAVPSLRKPVYLIHSTQKLIQVLNFQIKVDYHVMLRNMLVEGLELHNIYYKEFENPENETDGMFRKQYFRKPNIVKFDTVRVWFDKENGVIWDERPHYIPDSEYTYFKPVKPAKKSFVDELSGKELENFKVMLEEMYCFTHSKVQELESGRGYVPDEQEKQELLAEKREWLRILRKLKISPVSVC